MVTVATTASSWLGTSIGPGGIEIGGLVAGVIEEALLQSDLVELKSLLQETEQLQQQDFNRTWWN